MIMEPNQVKDIIEALIFISDNPVSLPQLKEVPGQRGAGSRYRTAYKGYRRRIQPQESPVELRLLQAGGSWPQKKNIHPG